MPVKPFITAACKATAWLSALPALALPAVLLTIDPANAGSASGSCVRSGGIVSCAGQWNRGNGGGGIPLIIQVAPPASEQQQALAMERERRWTSHCKPEIKQDRYGVGRYYYAAPGCEFGRAED